MGFLNISNEILYLSVILGLIVPFFGEALSPYIIHMLFLLMTLTLLSVNTHGLEKVRYKEVINLLFFNLVIYSSLLLVLSLFVENVNFMYGMIILAFVPPAISAVPFSKISGGDAEVSIVTEFIAYVLCLVYTPLMLWLFIGNTVDVFQITQVIASLIILPFVVSRIIRSVWKKSSELNPKIISSALIGLMIYSTIALSRDTILFQWESVITIFIIMFIVHFPLGTFIFQFTKRLGIIRKERIEYVIYGTFKNGGMALGFALLLFGPEAAVPIAISAIVGGFHLPYLSYLFEKHDVHPMKNNWFRIKHFFRRHHEKVKEKIG